ncbi:hypothetical protein [Ornithinimicrobium cerasi]|uniref:Uncharacterized protein n=1 Tax=Ornithinimicrobium cerasi TaxID=2248773 RepID=A0A285VAX1_9MICO|nr:hypothetical protein [Ornithinimicrobium cerasi]SOC51117.1 hypothetical protein SAMN05421879_10133 [Ornithinimicrobium cerasi]
MSDHDHHVLSPVGVLLHAHRSLARADAEATRTATRTHRRDDVDLAFALTCLRGQVLDLVPEPVRHLLSDVPAPEGVDPVDLAAGAEQVLRSVPLEQMPPGTGLLLTRLTETLRRFW